ncbi:hypothetical protein AB6D73_17110 [Vibrio splendidus]
MFYIFGFFSILAIRKNIKLSFYKMVVLVVLCCVFMGFFNARRAVGLDFSLMLEHVNAHGFLHYVFGTEFNVPARILYFIDNNAQGREAFIYPGHSLIVVTLNSIFPAFVWERLPTASMVLSRLYGTTGGLPLVIEFYANFNIKLLPICGIIMAQICLFFDYISVRLFKYDSRVAIIFLSLLMFLALNSQRIDFAISFKMFVVCVVITFVIDMFFKRRSHKV